MSGGVGTAAARLAALAALGAEAEERIRSAATPDALAEVRTHYLGRKAGVLTAILKDLPALDPDLRRAVGQRANETKQRIERWLEETERALGQRPADGGADLTMPARRI